MSGYSVVIPTMWKPRRFPDFLLQLCGSDKVDEVLVIDNNQKATAPVYHAKIHWLKQVRNIYVNPAWNLGVREARSAKICIANDDVDFDLGLFDFIDRHIHQSGIIGLDLMHPDGDFRLTRVRVREYGFGSLMFLLKDRYHEIPETMRVWYGDDYLLRVNYLEGFQNYRVSGAGNTSTNQSQTVSLISKELLDEDRRAYFRAHYVLSARYPVRALTHAILRRLGRPEKWEYRLDK